MEKDRYNYYCLSNLNTLKEKRNVFKMVMWIPKKEVVFQLKWCQNYDIKLYTLFSCCLPKTGSQIKTEFNLVRYWVSELNNQTRSFISSTTINSSLLFLNCPCQSSSSSSYFQNTTTFQIFFFYLHISYHTHSFGIWSQSSYPV